MKFQKELATSDLRQLTEDLTATDWIMRPVIENLLGSVMLLELMHDGNLMYLWVNADAEAKVMYDQGEGPVIRDSVLG